MTIDERIQAAVTPVVPRCAPRQYGGEDLEYCVYNYSELPDSFGDGRPRAIRYLVQVHWLFPWRPGVSADAAVLRKKTELRQRIGAAQGFTWPSVTPAGDNEWEHLVFEFEAVEGLQWLDSTRRVSTD